MSVFSPNTGKYRPETNLYLDTFHAVLRKVFNGVEVAFFWKKNHQIEKYLPWKLGTKALIMDKLSIKSNFEMYYLFTCLPLSKDNIL